MREVRRAAIQAQKNCKETLPRARRLTKEMLLYWKKYEKVEKEHRKRAEKEALEQRKLDEEMREVQQNHRLLILHMLRRHRTAWTIWVSESKPWNSVIFSVLVLFHIFLQLSYFYLRNYSNVSKRWLRKPFKLHKFFIIEWNWGRNQRSCDCLTDIHSSVLVRANIL